MSEPIKDGGPAFPCLVDDRTVNDGMSLRDYFAGQALVGLLASPVSPNREGVPVTSSRGYANSAYLWADSMIAARENKS